MHEFALIKEFFEKQNLHRPEVILGIGDDAAIISPPANKELVITTDSLVAEVHFFLNDSPYDIGYKSLAVNLSDLAAMGATPAWVTLALTLPEANERWLKDFCNGFFVLANQFNTQLIGGDLTKGPLSITVTAIGHIPKNAALRRDKAEIGDFIFVTNTLGDAGYALRFQNSLEKLKRPEPQVLIGEKLPGIANAAIDISDGLVGDLKHILEKSHVGATIFVDDIPLSKTLTDSLPKEKAIELALTAGDDYELCFTVPEKQLENLKKALENFSYQCIGKITEKSGLALQYKNGETYVLKNQSYQHF